MNAGSRTDANPVPPGLGLVPAVHTTKAPTRKQLLTAEKVWNAAYDSLKADPETKRLVEDHEKLMSLQLEHHMQGLPMENTTGRFGMAWNSKRKCTY